MPRSAPPLRRGSHQPIIICLGAYRGRDGVRERAERDLAAIRAARPPEKRLSPGPGVRPRQHRLYRWLRKNLETAARERLFRCLYFKHVRNEEVPNCCERRMRCAAFLFCCDHHCAHPPVVGCATMNFLSRSLPQRYFGNSCATLHLVNSTSSNGSILLQLDVETKLIFKSIVFLTGTIGKAVII